jgi:hypothetical protein
MRILKIDHTSRNLTNFAILLIAFHILHEPKIMKGMGTQTWLRKFDDGLKMHLNCT